MRTSPVRRTGISAGVIGVSALLAVSACSSSSSGGAASSAAAPAGSAAATTSAAATSAAGTSAAAPSGAAPSVSAATLAKLKKAKVGIVIKGLDNPFFGYMEQGIKAEAAALGLSVDVQSAASISDTSGQADKLSAIANGGYGCYLVNPISGTNLISSLASISARNIPIVNIDNPIDAKAAAAANVKISTYVGTDNTAAGKAVATELAKLLPDGGEVADVGGISGDVTSGQRITGFDSGLPANLKVIQTVSANWDRQQALTAATTILQAHPKLSAFFVANDDMAFGVARAVAAAKRTGLTKVVSTDGIPGVVAKQMDAVVAQYPYVVGKMGYEACLAAIAGNTLPASVQTPTQLVTPANAVAANKAYPVPPGAYADPFADLLAK